MSKEAECEYCSNYIYDEEMEEYECRVYLDEDDMAGYLSQEHSCCRYFQSNDEYKIVRKQN